MRSRRLALAALLCAAGCFQKLESGAASNTQPRFDADPGPTTKIEPGSIPIDIGPNEGDHTSSDPCDATNEQMKQIFTQDCAGCHGGGAAAMAGFDCVLDWNKLKEARSTLVKDPGDDSKGMRLLIPGDPEASRIYQMFSSGKMPPPDRVDAPPLPRPALPSAASLMREWITHCMAGTPAVSSPGGPAPEVPPRAKMDAGAAGTGGTGGTGGTAGTGGTGGTGGTAPPPPRMDAAMPPPPPPPKPDASAPPPPPPPMGTCGAAGQRCCAGNICAGGGCCVNGTCRGNGQLCGGGLNGTCTNGSCQNAAGMACGAANQGCCGVGNASVCTAPRQGCVGNTSCLVCGGMDERCCDGNIDDTRCLAGFECQPLGSALARCRPCGGLGQFCCGRGAVAQQTCNAGLICRAGVNGAPPQCGR